MRLGIGSALVQIMACRLFDAKPLLSVGPLGTNSVKFESKYKFFYPRKCIWKYRLCNSGHFVMQGEMSQHDLYVEGDTWEHGHCWGHHIIGMINLLPVISAEITFRFSFITKFCYDFEIYNSNEYRYQNYKNERSGLWPIVNTMQTQTRYIKAWSYSKLRIYSTCSAWNSGIKL